MAVICIFWGLENVLYFIFTGSSIHVEYKNVSVPSSEDLQLFDVSLLFAQYCL